MDEVCVCVLRKKNKNRTLPCAGRCSQSLGPGGWAAGWENGWGLEAVSKRTVGLGGDAESCRRERSDGHCW